MFSEKLRFAYNQAVMIYVSSTYDETSVSIPVYSFVYRMNGETVNNKLIYGIYAFCYDDALETAFKSFIQFFVFLFFLLFFFRFRIDNSISIEMINPCRSTFYKLHIFYFKNHL